MESSQGSKVSQWSWPLGLLPKPTIRLGSQVSTRTVSSWPIGPSSRVRVKTTSPPSTAVVAPVARKTVPSLAPLSLPRITVSRKPDFTVQ